MDDRITTPFEYGRQHYSDGIPRAANPYLHAAANNGATKPENRPSVKAWWSGWDAARAEEDSRVEASIVRGVGNQEDRECTLRVCGVNGR